MRLKIVALSLLGVGLCHWALAQSDGSQVDGLAQVKAIVNEAAAHYVKKEYEPCAEKIRQAQEGIAKILSTGDHNTVLAVRATYSRIKRAHELLAEQKIALPALVALPRPKKGTKPPPSVQPQPPQSANRPPNEADSPRRPPGEPISFMKDIAPLLARRCGGCHIRDNKGEFSMASFEVLMQGGENGEVIVPEDPVDSVLVELIEAGDMPPRDPKLTSQEVALIKNWVAAGAKFDGKDEKDDLSALVPSRGGPGRRGGPTPRGNGR